MAWIYLAESVASPSHSTNGLLQSPTVNRISTRKPSCSHECKTECFLGLQFGTTCELSEQAAYPMELQLTSYVEDSPARTSRLLAVEQAWAESEADFSSKWSALWKKFAPDLYFWRTSQPSELADFDKSSEHLPIFGMTVDGRVYLPQMLEPRTCESGGSYLPTPAATSYGTNRGGAAGRVGKERLSLDTMARLNRWPTPTVDDAHNVTRTSGDYQSLTRKAGGQLNPTWVEWLMGYSSEWTACADWATAWFLSARKRRSNVSQVSHD